MGAFSNAKVIVKKSIQRRNKSCQTSQADCMLRALEWKKMTELNLSLDPGSFPVLSGWSPARLEEVGRSMVEADGKEVTRERVLSYLAILESDLQGSRPRAGRASMRRRNSK